MRQFFHAIATETRLGDIRGKRVYLVDIGNDPIEREESQLSQIRRVFPCPPFLSTQSCTPLFPTWDKGNESSPRGDQLLVGLPVLLVLDRTRLVVSSLSVNEQDGEIDHIEVRERRSETAG